MDKLVTLESDVTREVMEMFVFPILKVLYYEDGSEIHKLIGTGFFIDNEGLFLTARHVFEGRGSALDLEGSKGYAVYCVHAVNMERKMVIRHIDVCSIKLRNDTDIAAGHVENNQMFSSTTWISNKHLKQTGCLNLISIEDIPEGTKIWTVAYPKTTIDPKKDDVVNINFVSEAYEGVITKHHPEYRDKGLLSWPCYETDMEIKGGASGGPVFISGSKGTLFAVNCAGTSPHSFSHVTSVVPLVPK